MKKVLTLFLAVSLVFGTISCSSDDSSSDSSVSDLINNGTSVVDLSEETIAEDVSVEKSGVTIKNGDFSGKTVTVNTEDVVLDNVTNVVIVVSDKVQSGTITVKSSNGDISIIVQGGSSVVLKGSEVSNVTVESEGVTVKSDESSFVENVKINEEVESVDLSGGKINKLDASKDSVINVNGAEVSKAEGGKFIADADANLPENVTKITISSVKLNDTANAKTSYEVGDRFDFTGLTATVTYSDETTKTVSLNKFNTTVTDFNSVNVSDSIEVTFTYFDTEVTGSLTVKITEATSTYKKLLNNGIDLLLEGSLDEGVQKIRSAYELEKNDETKLYYALTELALISTDSSVSSLLRNNFGIQNYPATLNALITGEWLKDYADSDRVSVYEITEDSSYGYYRVSGTPPDYYLSGETSYFSYLLDNEGDWIGSWEYDDQYITDVQLDDNGKYLVSKNSLPSSIKIDSSTKRYDVSFVTHKYVLCDETEKIPVFNVPSWLKDTQVYKHSLVGAVQTSKTATYLLLGNLVDCNPNGANELIDNILKVFTGKFDNAKEIASTLSESSVLVPAKVIEAFNLTETLGDSSIYLGKSELNVLISALQILRGTFEWISSYDLSLNVSSLKQVFDGDLDNLPGIMSSLASSNKILSVRSESQMAKSKNTFIESIKMLEDSYDYLISSTTSYPQAAKDTLESYGTVFCAAEKDLVNAIESGSVFYIPSENPFETGSWNVTKDDASFGIDMGKLFTAGYFSNVFEKSDSGLKLFCDLEYWGEYESLCEIELTSDLKTVADVQNAVEAKVKETYSEFTLSFDDFWITIDIKVNTSVLNNFLPGLNITETEIPICSL